uniref:RNA-dependent RNA polymerase n=1 Tax=Changdu Botou tick virus 1 TaxID=2972081 RepID=A0A9E7V250_9VIRU|nr:MAG: RNA-dependent RNA polymerase [Changdu Botou tick virus 1]
MAGIDKSLNAFGTACCPHFARFRKLCGLLSDVYDVGLEVPEFSGSSVERLSSFKQFLSGLIERRSHPWSVALRRLGIRSRMSIAHTLFLFRKTLPSKEPDLESFLDGISKPSPSPDPEFLDFCKAEINKLFPVNWDRTLYPDACLRSTISTKSCAEQGRSKGGCRRWVLDNKMPDISSRDDFVEHVLSVERYQRPRPSRLVAVETGGKWRKITVPSGELSALKPLHQAIYNRLSNFSWLLRGKESVTKFKEFVSVAGEIFVSGDYESATDFLNSEVSKHCLMSILCRSRQVPTGIVQMAMDSLSLPVELRGESGKTRVEDQRSGQMMGYLLSFPLLCLINYLTFRYAIRRDVPVKINGDDIVFRGTREEYETWQKVVGASGLVLSVGKTMISKRFFTLNSCLFESRRKDVKALPFIRSSALFPKDKDPESVMGITGRFRSFCPCYSGEKRSVLRTAFLKFNKDLLEVTQRSLTRGLGLPLNFPQLTESGLWSREAWYLSLEKEPSIPAPYSEWSTRPAGFKYIRVEKITEEIREAAKAVGSAWVEAAWQLPELPTSVDDWFDAMREGTYDWSGWINERTQQTRFNSARKRARLLGISPQNAARYLRPSRSLLNKADCKRRRIGVWVPEDFTPEMIFSSESNMIKCDYSVTDRKRTMQTNIDVEVDVRNYFKPTFKVGEIAIGNDRSITGKAEVTIGKNCFSLQERDPNAACVRVFARGGVGFAPPPCLL